MLRPQAPGPWRLGYFKKGCRQDGDEHCAPRGAVADDTATTRRRSAILEACTRVCRDLRRVKPKKALGGRSESDGQKGGLKKEFETQIAAEIERLIGKGASEGLDFEAIETAARREALRIAAKVVENKLNDDFSDYIGPFLPCSCGGHMCYEGRRPKTFVTVLGEMKLARAYYHCKTCKNSLVPRDRAFLIDRASLSPGVIRMTGLAAAMVSFEEGSLLLSELGGVNISTKQVERTAEALGRQIAEDERTYAEPHEQIVSTLYLGVDGTGIPVRQSEVLGRKGKQTDGSAKTREVKLCTVWSAESRDKEGRPTRDEGSVTYSAAIESAAASTADDSPFAQRVIREATRRGFDKAERQVVLGDGAHWIWNLSGEYFPGAIEIVDRFHAKERLSDASKAIYGVGSELGKQWAKERYDELDEGRLDDLLHVLNIHASTCDEARKCRDYISENRNRMRYPEFHTQGLCTSTGVVEAGCKLAIGTRLKRAGMHWTVQGADAIIALRCTILSGRFEDFWERRAEQAAHRTATLAAR